MAEIFNHHETLEKRRQLRRNAPEAETRLWQRLKAKQLNGYKFRRQFGVGPYILDFYCPAARLAIELDGPSHDGDDAQEYDAIRRQAIETLGIRFLRFTNAEIYQQLEAVLMRIAHALEETPASALETDND